MRHLEFKIIGNTLYKNRLCFIFKHRTVFINNGKYGTVGLILMRSLDENICYSNMKWRLSLLKIELVLRLCTFSLNQTESHDKMFLKGMHSIVYSMLYLAQPISFLAQVGRRIFPQKTRICC